MRRLVRGRHRVIDCVGRAGGFPVLDASTGAPAVRRPGEEESGIRRVGWPEFFEACERRRLHLLVDEDPDACVFRWVQRADARRALGPGRPRQTRAALAALGFPVGNPA